MKLRRANPWILPVILALILYAVISLGLMQNKLDTARAAVAELETQAGELETENAALEYAVEHPEDPEVIAGVAQDKLGLVMPGQQVFKDPAAE